MNQTAVVYLIRAAEGIEPVKRFVESYQEHDAGYDHDLILIYKGFKESEIPFELSSLFDHIPTTSHYVDDIGYDLTAYFSVHSTFEHEYFFFLNTFSKVLKTNWLRLVMNSLLTPGIGLVGCTGSYESMELVEFNPFPNYHIRSNAFAISKKTLGQIKFPEIKEKAEAYLFESGKQSLTSQVLSMSLEVLLVGCNGKSYLREDWWMSETFRQNEQANLIISDNQTELYIQADPTRRRYLSELAWGINSRRAILPTNKSMTNKPGCITVIIPTYNRINWLRRAVESVLQETRIPIQLHIFDNASTDNTEAYVRELMSTDSRVLYSKNTENVGSLANYSKAFDSIETEYFVPLADDDWLYPDYLYTAYQRIEMETALGAVIFKTDQKSKDGTSIPDSSLPPERLFEGYLDPESHMRQWLKYGHYTSWSAILWKTECLKLTPRPFFKIGLPFDVDFQVRVFSHYPVWLFNKLGAVYFMHENQSSHMFDLSQLCSWAQMFQTLDIYRDKHGFFEDAEYSSLRSTAIERYRWAWNRIPKTALTKKQISATIVASAYRLGDWPLAFRLLEDLAMNEEKSVAHCSQRFVVPPIGNIALSPSEAESISRSVSFILTTITWYKIQNNRLQNAEIEINKLKHLLSMEKERLKVLKQSTNELSFVLKKLKNAIKQLYALRQWKWAAFFSSPLRHREKREFHPLHEVLSELNKVTSTIKERINPKT